MKPQDFITENEFIAVDAEAMRKDNEVQMARQDCFNAAKDAIELHKLLGQCSEMSNLEGWVSEKLTLAADYLNTVREYLEYELISKHEDMPVFSMESANSKLDALLESNYLSEAPVAAPANPGQQADQMQQAMLDRMGKRFGLPPGSTMAQVQAAQQAYLNKNDPAAAAQYKQNMTNIDAGNTAATKPVQLAPKAAPAAPVAPAQDPNTAAGLAAAKAGKNPTEIMLAQPDIANNQQYLDSIASAHGLPAGSTVDQIKAAVAKPAAPAQAAPVVDQAAIEQKAIDDIAVKQGLPTGLTKDQFFKAYQDKLNQQQAAQMPAAPAPVGEARVGNRMADIEIGSPKIVYHKGKAVGEVGIDHEASPGNGPYYMKHYLTGKDMVGYDSKKEALADLKHLVLQHVGESAGGMGAGSVATSISTGKGPTVGTLFGGSYKQKSPAKKAKVIKR